MSNFQRPLSGSDKQAAGKTRKPRVSKNKRTIDGSTEVIPNFWEPDWNGTPENLKLLRRLLDNPAKEKDKLAQEFYTCSTLTSHVRRAVIEEATPIYMPGGALAFIQLRWHAPDKGCEKRFTNAYRAYRDDYMKEPKGERQPVLLDMWSHLYRNDCPWSDEPKEPGLLLPINADGLKRACDASRRAKTVAWFLCEGAHSMKGVERRLNDPAVAHIVEKWKREHGIDEIVVGGWVGGPPGAAHTNFGMRAHTDKQIMGQNDWPVDFSDNGPLERVVIVPDCDTPGYKEKEVVANRLHLEFHCAEKKIFEVKAPPNTWQRWDDYDDLPDDVTPEMRIEQLLNPKEWRPEDYITDNNGNFTLNPDNIAIKMKHLFDGDELIYFDEFHGCFMLDGPLPNQTPRENYPHRLDDGDVTWITSMIRHQPRFHKASEEGVREALRIYSNAHRRHPIREYLEGLTWDGNPRVDTIFIDYLHAEDNDENRLSASILLKEMVARILYPGCLAQYVVALIGPQKTFKSTFCRKLASDEYFSDCLPRLDNRTQLKEAQAHLAGHWLLEIAENAAFKNAESETLKNFITMQADIYCAKYAHLDKRHPRQSIFIITANLWELFKDLTGNRRYLPVEIAVTGTPTAADMERFEENRDQIFAEAYYRITELSESWYPTPEQEEELLTPRQAEHRATEPWEEQFLDDIHAALAREDVLIWPKDLRTYFLDRAPRFRKLVKKEEYAAVLRAKGWTSDKNRKIRVWDKTKGEPVSSDNTHCCWSRAEYKGAMEHVLAYAKGKLDEPGAWIMDGTWKRPTPPEAGGDPPDVDYDAPGPSAWDVLDRERRNAPRDDA